MISKKIINPERIRRIHGGFSFIPHRFLTDGFLDSLSQGNTIVPVSRYGLRSPRSFFLFLQCDLFIAPNHGRPVHRDQKRTDRERPDRF